METVNYVVGIATRWYTSMFRESETFVLFYCYTYRVKDIKKRKKKASYAVLTVERSSVHRTERKGSNTIKRTFRVTVYSLLSKVVSKEKPQNDVVSRKRNVFKKFARYNIYNYVSGSAGGNTYDRNFV